MSRSPQSRHETDESAINMKLEEAREGAEFLRSFVVQGTLPGAPTFSPESRSWRCDVIRAWDPAGAGRPFFAVMAVGPDIPHFR